MTMKLKNMRFPLSLSLLCLLGALSAPLPSLGAPGLLSTFSNEGKHLFTPRLFNRTANPVDLSRPLNLLHERDRVLRFDSIHEDIHRLEKNGVLVSSIRSTGKKIFALYPAEREAGKGTTVAGFDRYGSSLRFFNNSGIDNTIGTIRGSGSALSLARRRGRLLAGVHKGTAALQGDVVSEEINNRSPMLSPDAVTSISLKEQRRVWALGYRMGRFEAAWQDNRFRAPAHVTLSDSDSEFRFPVVSSGSSHEASLRARLSATRRLVVFYAEGEGESFDRNRYHISNPASTNEFANLSKSTFRNYGIGAVGKISKRYTLRVEVEAYTGSLNGAGLLDVLNVVSGLFGNYYLYRFSGDIHFSLVRLHLLRSGGRVSYALAYTQMPFNADYRFYGCDKKIIGCQSEITEEGHYRNSRIHTLALGLKMKIGNGKSLEYSITQIAPQVTKVEPCAPPAPPGPPAAPETKKERGGTTHFFSLEFRF